MMNKYKYKARDKNGKEVIGEVEASNESVAARLVRERGYILIKLSKSGNGIFGLSAKFSSRVSGGDVTAFTRQLATMVNAGLPVTESLQILRLQSKTGMKAVATQILADVESGESLSKAFEKHPKVFSPTYIALVKAGETGGVLDKVLGRLADNLEKAQEFRGKVKGAMIYPAIIVIGMVVVSTIMVVFIMPRLTELYTQFDAELPITTRILTGVSDFIINFWYIVLAGLGAGFFAFKAYAKTKAGQIRIANIVFKIPILGPLQKEVILTELTRTLSLMVGSGVPILEGLTVTSGVVGNVIISDALQKAAKQIEKGFPISYSFAQYPDAFPYILAQMISVGEETGKMEEVLSKVSHVFEVDSEQKVKALTAAIEPIIMIVLGIGVAFLVVSVILPIYNLTTSL
jgi:type IV pilus assembly protein PilC